MRNRPVVLAVLLTATLISGKASAALIDFTSSAFAGATGLESFETTIDGVGVTLLEAKPAGAALKQTSEGLGVDSPWYVIGEDPGEIGVPERIIVTFDDAQFIDEIYVSQLFRESGWMGTINETGWYSIDGGDKVWFEAAADASGLLSIAVGKEGSSLEFGAKLAGGSHDYSLSALNVRTLDGSVTAIPEPFSAAMLGIGGILVGAAVRRREA
jgi:hypothetical protein